MRKVINFIMGFVACLVILCVAPAQAVNAAEFTVTDYSAVYYTNDETRLYVDADTSLVAIDGIASNLPVQVTGVTSNGFYRVSIASETYYVPGVGLCAEPTLEDLKVLYTLLAQVEKFPDGSYLTNESYFYRWNGGIYSGGYGCAGFAFYLSDQAFGDVKAYIHKDYSNIRVGDILRVYNDTHCVIVLEVREDSVVVAEGNYHSSVKWGRVMSMSEIQDSSSYIMSRY